MEVNLTNYHSNENILKIWKTVPSLSQGYQQSNKIFLKKFEELAHALCWLADKPKLINIYKCYFIEFGKFEAVQQPFNLDQIVAIENIAYKLLLLSRDDRGLEFLSFRRLVSWLKKRSNLDPEVIEQIKKHPSISKMTQYIYNIHLENGLRKELNDFVNIWKQFEPQSPSLKNVTTTELDQIHNLITSETCNKKTKTELINVLKQNLSDCSTAIVMIIENNKLDLLELLINTEKIRLKIMPDQNSGYFLQRAAELGRLAIVKYLIKTFNVELDSSAVSFDNPLLLAITNGHLSSAKYLIENDKNINMVNCFYYLIQVIQRNDFYFLKEINDLYEQKLKIYNHPMRDHGLSNIKLWSSSIHDKSIDFNKLAIEAFRNHETNIIALLQTYETYIDNQNILKSSLAALINEYMEKGQYYEIVKLNYFSVYASENLTPESLHKQSVKLILSNQIKNFEELLQIFPDCPKVLLGVAAQYGTLSDLKFCIELLQTNLYEINLRYNTPLLLDAIRGNKIDNVEYLVNEHNLKINYEFNGIKPLALASSEGYVQIAKFLIKNNAIANEEMLIFWVRHGVFEMVELMINRGVIISNDYQSGKTEKISKAANIALKCGHLEILKLLLENGAIIALEHALMYEGVVKNLNFFKYLIEELKAPLQKDVKKHIEGCNFEIIKYLEEKHKIGIRDLIYDELNKLKKIRDGVFTSLVKHGSFATLHYFFEELNCYPTLDQLKFHTLCLPKNSDGFFSSMYLYSLIDDNPDYIIAYRLIAERNYTKLDNIVLKEIFESANLNFKFKCMIKSIMRDKVISYFLARIFKDILPKDISHFIASYKTLPYPFPRKQELK